MNLEVVCPICDAAPGERCYDPHGLPPNNSHFAREKAAKEARDKARAERFADMAMQNTAGRGVEDFDPDAVAHRPLYKIKADVAIGDAVEVFVVERSAFARGTSEKWLPATVCSVSANGIGVAFSDGERMELPIHDNGRNWRYAP